MAANPDVMSSLSRLGITETDILELTSRTDPGTTHDSLLDELVADGQLTRFQADHILEGGDSPLVLDNYLILGEIGSGAMGVVFKALHRRMDRVVAIKLIKAEIATAHFIGQFQGEVRAAARLNHPNAIAAYDAGDSQFGPYLVMEYVAGSDLQQIVREHGPLSVREALECLRQAASGIGYAHQQGIVHRDIKPANLMRDVHGTIKIADLGLAHLVSSSVNGQSSQSSSNGKVQGTLAFMSPEQSYGSDNVDHRTDIYSLGCTLFYLLTGRTMLDEPSVAEFLEAQRHQPAPSLTEVRSDVPAAVDALFQKMVAKNREERFVTMSEVIENVDVILGDTTSDDATWDAASATVFIAESSGTLMRLMQGMLADLGCDDLHPHTTGQSVLEALKHLQPDLLVASMELADMTGLELGSTDSKGLSLVTHFDLVDEQQCERRSARKSSPTSGRRNAREAVHHRPTRWVGRERHANEPDRRVTDREPATIGGLDR